MKDEKRITIKLLALYSKSNQMINWLQVFHIKFSWSSANLFFEYLLVFDQNDIFCNETHVKHDDIEQDNITNLTYTLAVINRTDLNIQSGNIVFSILVFYLVIRKIQILQCTKK